MKTLVIFAISCGMMGAISLPAQERGQEDRGQRQEHRKEGDKARPQYHFRQEDRGRLRDHYDGINRVDRDHRGRFGAGDYLPQDWHRRMHRVPRDVVVQLPPPPAGYVFGYIDGYCVVYDPRTGYIADVIDLDDLH